MNVETQPLVSAECGAAFPIALCILFAGLSALVFGWRSMVNAYHWVSFCGAVGGAQNAHKIVKSFALEKASRDRSAAP
jgi:hypothetical protein